jgi:hypothetical protein
VHQLADALLGVNLSYYGTTKFRFNKTAHMGTPKLLFQHTRKVLLNKSNYRHRERSDQTTICLGKAIPLIYKSMSWRLLNRPYGFLTMTFKAFSTSP